MTDSIPKKPQAELEIEALQSVFNIATTGFDEFYKSADKSASSGDSSTAASSGNYSTAASSGDSSKAASSGNFSTAASSGKNAGCAAIGYRAAVKGDLGNLIMVSEYNKNGDPLGGKADLVDGKTLRANTWYIVENSEWVEVDFSDNFFSYVLSRKGNVKKIKTERGEILYIVSDDKGNFSHGKTIAKARADLVYKVMEKSDVKIPKKAKGTEWIGIYRAVTGACAAGIKNFVETKNLDIEKDYTSAQIAKLAKGNYGEDAFLKRMRG